VPSAKGRARQGRPAPVGRKLQELEKRLAALEAQLRDARRQAGQTGGSGGERRSRLQRDAVARAERVRETLQQSLEQLSRVLATSRERVERETDRLSRALRAGMKASTEAYRRSRKG